jgi:hypothetical protein
MIHNYFFHHFSLIFSLDVVLLDAGRESQRNAIFGGEARHEIFKITKKMFSKVDLAMLFQFYFKFLEFVKTNNMNRVSCNECHLIS